MKTVMITDVLPTARNDLAGTSLKHQYATSWPADSAVDPPPYIPQLHKLPTSLTSEKKKTMVCVPK